MEAPKIHLSPAESELMENAAIILTKNSVLQKIKLLLEEVQEHQSAFVKQNDFNKPGIFSVPPKISKGENYSGLPYLILDYPRVSSSPDLFFIRNMFWWGNFFSITLHLSGSYKETFKKNIIQSFPLLQEYFIGINTDPWMHHFEGINYQKIGSLTREEFDESCERFNYIKIASRFPLKEWKQAPGNLFESWKFLLAICGLIS